MIIIAYLEQGRTINVAFYTDELKLLRQEISRNRRGKLTRSVLLLQDNAPAHTSQAAMTSATECGFEILPNLPYSSDIASSDFYLLQKLKSNLRGTQYGSNEGVREAVNEYLVEQERPSILKGEESSDRDRLSALP